MTPTDIRLASAGRSGDAGYLAARDLAGIAGDARLRAPALEVVAPPAAG